jgi:hypothetical protein
MDRYTKAIAAALVAAYALYQTATGQASPGGEAVVVSEWVGVVVTGVTAGLAVWAVPNKQEPKA